MRRKSALSNHKHPRLIGASLCGLIAGLLAYTAPLTTRILIGWNSAVWLYLALSIPTIWRHNALSVKQQADAEDENAKVVLAIVTIAAVASLAAIIVDLVGSRNFSLQSRGLHYMLSGVTVVGSWLLIGVIFTLHYAQLFYSTDGLSSLRFPEGTKEPDYWDFLYFSFTINVALQTSDITIASPAMRRVVLAQSIVCFLFNTAILGFSINIAAGLATG